ncbi:MAG: OB-fold nucleic acid binding domain-containing protein, partial [Acidimicrobiia bacterium]
SSLSDFSVDMNATNDAGGSLPAIRFGMSAIRNVGEGLVNLIVEEREKNGPFVDFYEFCERVDPAALNKRTIESLIKAGGFDSLGHTRQGLATAFESIIERTLARRREREAGVMSLFGDVTGTPDSDSDSHDERVSIPLSEYNKSARLAFEKEMLGLYVSEHPMMSAQRSLARFCDATVADLRTVNEGELRSVGGVVTGLTRKYTKKGDLMATFALEDLAGSVEVMVFPKVMSEYGAMLHEDAIVVVRGRVDARDEVRKLMSLEIRIPELVLDGGPPVRLRIRSGLLSDSNVTRLKGVLSTYPGPSAVFLHLEHSDKTTVVKLGDEFLVEPSAALFGELRELLGENCIA